MNHMKKRRNLRERVKGFEGGRRNLIKMAKTAETKAGDYARASRRKKKGEARRVWEIRINAAVREAGMSYSKFIGALNKKGIKVNRKLMADIAAFYPQVFAKLIEMAK